MTACLPICPQKMHNRFFDGRRVEASLYNGKNRFKRSGGGAGQAADDIEGDNDAAEKKRLDEFADWLMTEGD
jgi:HIV Tat-specific factor 1